jgi:hypothetical protein
MGEAIIHAEHPTIRLASFHTVLSAEEEVSRLLKAVGSRSRSTGTGVGSLFVCLRAQADEG